MEVEKARCYSFEDSKSLKPVKVCIFFSIQELVKASIGHIIIDQEEFTVLAAIS